jgi:hypothetical protein
MVTGTGEIAGARIRALDEATPKRWQEAWDASNSATFFHSPAWFGIWHDYTSGEWRAEPILARFADGREAVVTLARRVDAATGRSFSVSSPAGTYGGWVSADPLTPAHARRLQRLLVAMPGLVWRVNPYDPSVAGLDPDGQRDEQTMVVDLRAGFESIVRGWRRSGSMLRAVRRARRSGLETVVAGTRDDWHAYFGLYRLSLARWGARATSDYGQPLFERLAAEPRSHVRLWLVRHEGRPVAGAVVFYAKRHAVYWHGAADGRAFPMRPINLLMHDVMADAAARGFWWWDFNPSGGHAGVARFKRGCGGRPLPSPVFETAPGPRVAFPAAAGERIA